MSAVKEGLATQIIRKFHGLEGRPEVSDETKAAMDKIAKDDPSRKEDDKEKKLDKDLGK